MTETSTTAGGAPTAQYIQLWAEQAAQVVGQITGTAASCTVRSDEPDRSASGGEQDLSEQDLWVLVTSSGALRGEMRLRVPRATVLWLAQTFMSEPVNATAELTADHKDALIELLRQIAGLVSTAAKKRWGEIQLHVEAAAGAPSWPPAETFWLQVGEAGPAAMALEVGLSAALAAELRAERSEAAKAETPASPPPASSANEGPPPGSPAGAIDLLRDVQLAVTMRFGAHRLRLREVLELTPGAVIELDRKVQEPVDLLLDDRVIARGEVVVINGDYGLRVTDASPLDLPAVAQRGQGRGGTPSPA
jgi:flagellar motor switch protein FliN/FliY